MKMNAYCYNDYLQRVHSTFIQKCQFKKKSNTFLLKYRPAIIESPLRVEGLQWEDADDLKHTKFILGLHQSCY